MTIAETMLPEFDHEMKVTRTVLERVPEEQRDWKPHAKSMTLGALAVHVATIGDWAQATVKTTELDLAGPEAAAYRPAPFTTTKALLDVFDEGVRKAREVIAAASDADLAVVWSLKHGAHTILAMPRTAVLRSFVMNHLIHHRGQLTVYLRLRDVPLPSVYGPSADSEQ